MLDNLNDAAFCAPVRPAAYDAGQHAIAVHRVSQVVATDKKIAFYSGDRSIWDEKSVAVAMGDNSASNKIGIVSALRCRSASWLLVFWSALRGNFLGSRLAVPALCRGFLGFLCSRQFVAAAAGFLYVATFLEAMQDTREESSAMMFQLHAVGDLADAGGLRKRGEIGQDEFRAESRGRRLYLRVVGMTLVRNAHRDLDWLEDWEGLRGAFRWNSGPSL